MDSFHWDESLSVGVQRIDDQHRQLLRMFRGLEEAMKAGRSRPPGVGT